MRRIGNRLARERRFTRKAFAGSLPPLYPNGSAISSAAASNARLAAFQRTGTRFAEIGMEIWFQAEETAGEAVLLFTLLTLYF
jgi:hypothetical protein